MADVNLAPNATEANMLDYLNWRGDLTFDVSPFNEVDNLILSEITYADLSGIAGGLADDGTVSIERAYEVYDAMRRNQAFLGNDPKPAFAAAARSRRFGNTRIGLYRREISSEKKFQFSAMTFFLEDGSVYVGYRGTDSSIVGWREDFAFAYMRETGGQEKARRYLDRVCELTGNMPVRVGGHSKGGNLAVHAAAFCKPENRDRIAAVYSNDGPGFRHEVTESEEYAAIMDRAVSIIPESSMIGILLANKLEREVICSSAKGIQQHNPYTWCVTGTSFDRAEKQSQQSQMIEDIFMGWFNSLEPDQTEAFVKAIFDTLEGTGAETFRELKADTKYLGLIYKAAQEMDPDLRKGFLDVAQKLLDSGWDVISTGAKTSMSAFAEGLWSRGGSDEEE